MEEARKLSELLESDEFSVFGHAIDRFSVAKSDINPTDADDVRNYPNSSYELGLPDGTLPFL